MTKELTEGAHHEVRQADEGCLLRRRNQASRFYAYPQPVHPQQRDLGMDDLDIGRARLGLRNRTRAREPVRSEDAWIEAADQHDASVTEIRCNAHKEPSLPKA